MTDREHEDMSTRIEKAQARDVGKIATNTLCAAVAGPYSDTGLSSGCGRDAIRSEINRLTGRIEQLKALDRILPKELSPMAEDAVRALVLGSVR